MPETFGGITVDPQGQTLVVTFTNSAGNTPTAYTAANGSSTHTLPLSITTTTTFHFAQKGPMFLSAKLNDVEIADKDGTTLPFNVEYGSMMSVAPVVDPAYELSLHPGTYAVEDHVAAVDPHGDRAFTAARLPIGRAKAGDILTNIGGQASGTITTTNNREYALPFVIPSGRTIANFLCSLSTAGAASTVGRWGVRADDNGWPGTLVEELGTVALDGSTGVITLTNATTVDTEELIWIVLAIQGGTPVLINGGALQGRGISLAQPPSNWNNAVFGCPYQDSVSGALPAAAGGRSNWNATTSPLLAVTLA